MTTTNEIVQKLNDVLIALGNSMENNIEAAEKINAAIIMLENKRMDEKRVKFLLDQQAVKSEDVIFLRRQAQ